ACRQAGFGLKKDETERQNMARIRHITLPKGFVAGAAACGIKPSGKMDLAIIAAQRDCSAAIVTTSNQIVAAPILYDRRILPRGAGKVRGIVINAGNSNVCTGRKGLRDAETMAGLAAKQLGTVKEKVLVASTGVIGRVLPMAKVRRGVAAAAKNLNRGSDSAVLRAIMTTDTREKSAVVRIRVGGKAVTIAGMVKGSGMIDPSLATMIAVVTTDAAIAPTVLKKALNSSIRETFNAITVDGDQSTSDIVAVMASGAAGDKPIAAGTANFRKFTHAMNELCGVLARKVVADGEGATRVIEISIRGARSDGEAKIAAKAIANSPLVKTAVHGGDPNWGRIAMALGKSPARVVADKLTISIGDQRVFACGVGRKFDAGKVRRHLRGGTVRIDCTLGFGKGSFTALTCDLSGKYITINADYTT
ncbi:MAG: bifunctional glutamate N-acetyltransferase/amino-acid acetyltransferase ArgJ, partial [Candidatus Hydrogenedentes bacterium]|nr:bifunctional glutamate N-acetyltransferase/amino-acid acetyltransferase ArgJ [Candidatus Hydrogenedentota bacterium]